MIAHATDPDGLHGAPYSHHFEPRPAYHGSLIAMHKPASRPRLHSRHPCTLYPCLTASCLGLVVGKNGRQTSLAQAKCLTCCRPLLCTLSRLTCQVWPCQKPPSGARACTHSLSRSIRHRVLLNIGSVPAASSTLFYCFTPLYALSHAGTTSCSSSGRQSVAYVQYMASSCRCPFAPELVGDFAAIQYGFCLLILFFLLQTFGVNM